MTRPIKSDTHREPHSMTASAVIPHCPNCLTTLITLYSTLKYMKVPTLKLSIYSPTYIYVGREGRELLEPCPSVCLFQTSLSVLKLSWWNLVQVRLFATRIKA